MEVKAETNYLVIKDKLNELKAEGMIEYMEGCLSVNHQY
jgi:peptide deformylase